MRFITIDGDDVGQIITSAYLRNDLKALEAINENVNNKTRLIADFLRKQGFSVIFCAADGVAGYCDKETPDDDFIFDNIKNIAGNELSFSVGIGNSLRESYTALLSAKSSGKACMHNFKSLK